jgi:hypothetical protein
MDKKALVVGVGLDAETPIFLAGIGRDLSRPPPENYWSFLSEEGPFKSVVAIDPEERWLEICENKIRRAGAAERISLEVAQVPIGSPVKKAVITVPAYFDDNYRTLLWEGIKEKGPYDLVLLPHITGMFYRYNSPETARTFVGNSGKACKPGGALVMLDWDPDFRRWTHGNIGGYGSGDRPVESLRAVYESLRPDGFSLEKFEDRSSSQDGRDFVVYRKAVAGKD